MTKKKSLRKVTDIGKIQTVKDIKEFVKTNPERANEMLDKLQGMINNSYAEKLGLEHELIELIAKCYTLMNNELSANFVRNATYETNHTIIGSFIHNYICEYRFFPSIMTIKKETGLSRQTIYRHINNGFTDKFNIVVRGKIEYMIPKALEKLYLIGVRDNNATALKHFIELSGFTSKINTTNVNNYIQINNLKLSKEEFNQLPNQILLEIEKLIKDTQTPKTAKVTREV